MNATQYFKRMTLDELVNWYNENVAINFDGPFGRIMPYNEETLREIADYCGMVQYTKMVARCILLSEEPEYILYDADNNELRTYEHRIEFLNDFEDAMCEEYENQVPDINTEE